MKDKSNYLDSSIARSFSLLLIALAVFALCFTGGLLFMCTALSEIFSVSVGLAQSETDANVFTAMSSSRQWNELVSSGREQIGAMGYGKTGFWSWCDYSGIIGLVIFYVVIFLFFCFVLLFCINRCGKAMGFHQQKHDDQYRRVMSENEETKQKVMQLKEEKKCFEETVQNICHQFRTPLSGLRLTIEQMSGDDERRSTCLYTLDRLSEKIIAMLNLGKFESNIIQIEKKLDDLAVALEDSIDAVTPLAESCGVGIDTCIPESAQWSFNYFWIREAFENILKNAVERSQKGETVRVRLVRDQSNYILTFHDMAGGVRHANIFDRYVSFQNNGFGIGLHLAYTIINYHFGNIAALENKDGGTTFEVVFPIIYGVEPYVTEM